METTTVDTFFKGCIQVKQDRRGYRFSIDSVLLSHHASPKPHDIVLDLGTGCGIIPMILAYRNPEVKIFGIEIQKKLAEIAAINIADNLLTDRVSILHKDMRQLRQHHFQGPVDMIISNPPYRKADSGRINPHDQRAVARHELRITLQQLIETAAGMLRTAGKFIVIYPAERLTDLIATMRRAGIEPKLLRMIHSRRLSEAKLVLVEGLRQGRPGIRILPPIIIYNGEQYTDEVERMFHP